MINSLGAGISGLRAMGTRLDVASNNVANANTDGYKKRRVQMEEGINGGVTSRVTKTDTPGDRVQDQGGERELSNVDLAEEMVEAIATKAVYGANTRLIRTEDEMTGSVLDIVG